MGILQLDIRNQEAKSFYLTSLSSPTKYHQPTQHLNPTPIQNVYLDLLYARKSTVPAQQHPPQSAVSSKAKVALQGRQSVTSVMGTSVAVSRFLVRSCRGV